MSNLSEIFFEFVKDDLGRFSWVGKDGSDAVVKKSDQSFPAKKDCVYDAYQHGHDAPEMRHDVKVGSKFLIEVEVVPEAYMRKKGVAIFVNGWPGGKLLEGLFQMTSAIRVS